MATISITNTQGVEMNTNVGLPQTWDNAHDETTGGSLGTDGLDGNPGSGGSGKTYGGGGGAALPGSGNHADGGPGGIRIIWPGDERSFPSTRTADE